MTQFQIPPPWIYTKSNFRCPQKLPVVTGRKPTFKVGPSLFTFKFKFNGKSAFLFSPMICNLVPTLPPNNDNNNNDNNNNLPGHCDPVPISIITYFLRQSASLALSL